MCPPRAAGARAAAHIAARIGEERVIAFDMGGTTAKMCLVERGVPHRKHEFEAGPGAEVPPGRRAAARLWREANEERNRSYLAELRAGERDEADVAAGGYESVSLALAVALAGGPAARLILNVPNGDTIPSLPPDLVIEAPCRVDAAGAVPLPVPAPSGHELGLMSAVRGCERDIAAAALSRDPAEASRLALRAFASHPLVGSLGAARVLAGSAFPVR